MSSILSATATHGGWGRSVSLGNNTVAIKEGVNSYKYIDANWHVFNVDSDGILTESFTISDQIMTIGLYNDNVVTVAGDYSNANGTFKVFQPTASTTTNYVVDGSSLSVDDADKLDGQHGTHYRINIYDANGTLVN